MLESLLYPNTVAVIGASRSPGKVGHAVVVNLINSGDQGAIIPVNPQAGTVLGLPCYASLEAYGQPIDMAVIVVPPPAVKPALESAIRAGAKAVVVITAGFKEVGPEGAAMEQELVALCTNAGVRLMGPNCLGVLNMHHRMNATFTASQPPVGGISVISQSGALCVAILIGR